MVHSSPQKSTRQQLVKVPQVPCLYRHALNHRYYGIKKVGGKRKEHALKTTDRKLVERRLKSWLDGLGKLDVALEHMTLRRLVEKLQRVNQGKASKTQATDRSIIKQLEVTWPADYDMKVMDIRPSHLNECRSLRRLSSSRLTSLVLSAGVQVAGAVFQWQSLTPNQQQTDIEYAQGNNGTLVPTQ